MTRALDYSVQICNAIEHAHRQGVLHRDLRPANVLVSDQDVCKVADFGTSRFLEIAAHGTTVIGSPPYMAPEQFHGKAVFASDLYSLGVTMYQMLTGVLPYDTPPPADIERLLRGELVTPPRLKNAAIPRRLNDIVMQAMAADVAQPLPARVATCSADLLDTAGPRCGGRPRCASRRRTASRPGPRDAAAAGRRAGGACHAPRDAVDAGSRFCWNCRKPLHARTDRCPFCRRGAVRVAETHPSSLPVGRGGPPGARLARARLWPFPVSHESRADAQEHGNGLQRAPARSG